MAEQQQVAIEVQGVIPPGGNSLMGQSLLGKATDPRMSLVSPVPLHVCCHLSLVSCMVWVDMGRPSLAVMWWVYLIGNIPIY